MARSVIAVDIDDVLVPHYEELATFLNQRFGSHLVGEDFYRLQGIASVEAEAGVRRDVVIAAVEDFLASPDFYIDPFPAAFDVLSKLQQCYQLVIITARPTSIERLTIEWLERHFPSLFTQVRFVGATSWGQGGHSDKLEPLKRLQVSILIDDSLRHCLAAAEIGIQALLFGSYHWNETRKLPQNIKRVENWSAVERVLLS